MKTLYIWEGEMLIFISITYSVHLESPFMSQVIIKWLFRVLREENALFYFKMHFVDFPQKY